MKALTSSLLIAAAALSANAYAGSNEVDTPVVSSSSSYQQDGSPVAGGQRRGNMMEPARQRNLDVMGQPAASTPGSGSQEQMKK